jgi:hypothetical protein
VKAPWKIFFALAATHRFDIPEIYSPIRTPLMLAASLILAGEIADFLFPFCVNGMIYYVQSVQDPAAYPLEGIHKVIGNGYFLSFVALFTGLTSTLTVQRFYFISVKLGLVSKSCLQVKFYLIPIV